MRAEEPLIIALQNGNDVRASLQNVNACGRFVLETIAAINARLHYTGKVVNYYDSSTVDYDDPLQTLMTNGSSETFVSYVSMVFGAGVDPVSFTKVEDAARFSQLHLLSCVKSVVDNSIRGYRHSSGNFMLPKWSPWRAKSLATILIRNPYAVQIGLLSALPRFYVCLANFFVWPRYSV